jgi:hypothetical protein
MDALDILAYVLWFNVFAAPVVALWWAWRLKRLNWFERIGLGLAIGIVVGFLLFALCLEIVFRNGMGP